MYNASLSLKQPLGMFEGCMFRVCDRLEVTIEPGWSCAPLSLPLQMKATLEYHLEEKLSRHTHVLLYLGEFSPAPKCASAQPMPMLH